MMWWERVAGALAFITVTGFGIWYTNHVNHASERRQCDLINLQVKAYAEAPPATDTGRALAAAYARFKDDRHC